MAQREKFNRFNLGADDYFDRCNKNNFYYEDNDYKLKRYKHKDSIIVRETDENGKIVGIVRDIGLSHHQHGVTQDLSSDRLFLNKIDTHRMRMDDFKDNSRVAQRDNLTAKDWRNRIYRISKLVDRDRFHDQLGYIEEADNLHYTNHMFHNHYLYRKKRRR